MNKSRKSPGLPVLPAPRTDCGDGSCGCGCGIPLATPKPTKTGKQRTRPTGEGGANMEPVRMSLCHEGAECPEVVVERDEVRIGEAGNLAVLKKDEWNILVELIRSGQLTQL